MPACLTNFERDVGGGASPILSAWPGRLARCGGQDRHGHKTAGDQQTAWSVPQSVGGGQGPDFGSGGGDHGDGRSTAQRMLTALRCRIRPIRSTGARWRRGASATRPGRCWSQVPCKIEATARTHPLTSMATSSAVSPPGSSRTARVIQSVVCGAAPLGVTDLPAATRNSDSARSTSA